MASALARNPLSDRFLWPPKESGHGSFDETKTTDNIDYVFIEFNKSLNYIYPLANKKCLLYYQTYKRAFVWFLCGKNLLTRIKEL